jgi:hypothetical protein
MPETLATPATLADLHTALDASPAFAATYPAGHLQLSNHLPMALATWEAQRQPLGTLPDNAAAGAPA